MLSQVQLRDDETRRRAMRKRWAWVLSSKRRDGGRRAETGEQALAWFRRFFAKAAANPWLTGEQPSKTHPNWRADFDFLLRDAGWKAVIERTEAAA